MLDTITGRVAAVVDDTTLILNVGARDGVHEGMLFAVVAEHQEVRDPGTGESLGRWESVKGRVVVTHVQPRMATARSPLTDVSPGATGTLSEMMVRHSFGLYGSHEQDRARLDVRVGVGTGRPRTQPIEVGDAVRSVSLAGLGAAPPPTAPDLPSHAYAVSAPATELGGE